MPSPSSYSHIETSIFLSQFPFWRTVPLKFELTSGMHCTAPGSVEDVPAVEAHRGLGSVPESAAVVA
jgi:hypothetical protein